MLPSEEIKNKISVVDLVGEYVPLKKAGANYRGLCPFHQEKTPSMMVSPSKQIWHCFGCGLGGDIFEFVKQVEGVEFPEALQILATRAGITLQRPTVAYQQEKDEKKVLLQLNDLAAKFFAMVLAQSPSAKEAREYLQKRGFRPETIQKWQLGFALDDFHALENFIVKKGFQRREGVAAGLLAEKDGGFFDRFRGRIMFPLYDTYGRVVGFTGRILDQGSPSSAQGGSGSTTAKYVNSPETLIYVKGQLIYGLHLAKTEIRKLDEAIVVEGNVDVITCHEAGFTNVVGSSGTAFTEMQLEVLKRFTKNVSFALDADEAGLVATRRAVELALAAGFNVRIVSIPKALAKDPDELIRRDPQLWKQQVETAQTFLDFYFAAVFANLNVESSVDKKQAVADLLPLLSLLPDPMDRSHYLRKLAQQLAVDERILLDLLQKYTRPGEPGQSRPAARVFGQRKGKQEILEQRVMGLLLKFMKNLQADWATFRAEDFLSPTLREIFETFQPRIAAGETDLAELTRLSPKFAPEVDLLVFAVENELSFSPDWNLDDVKKQFIADLQLGAIKRKMQQLTFLIQQAEARGQAESAKTLSLEFNNLTHELSKYHDT